MTGCLLVLLLVVCSGLCQDQPIELDESFNPDSLKDPPLGWPIMLHPGDRLPEKRKVPDADTTQEGYQVQVISTQDIELADSLRDELSDLFDHQVNVTFDPPNYKVRVGNFRYRSDAEKAEVRLKKMGYRTAWVIRTRIKVKPPPRRR